MPYSHAATMPTSSMVTFTKTSELYNAIWYHGTDCQLSQWHIPPPPPKNSLIVAHTAVFFSASRAFARKAGKNVYATRLRKRTKILDTVQDRTASEQLRQCVKNNAFARHTHNVEYDFWHQGWQSGNVLRLAYSDSRVEHHLQQMIIHLHHAKGIPLPTCRDLVYQNCARGLIELICTSAARMGFDALFGHEIDRHTCPDRPLSQPILGIFHPAVLRPPRKNKK
jgi:hypothetical protein